MFWEVFVLMVDVVEGVVLASVFRRVCAFVLDVLLLLMFFGFLFFIGLGASDLFVYCFPDNQCPGYADLFFLL